MKKLLALLLILCMLGMYACGEEPKNETGETAGQAADILQIGYARVDITPGDNVEMAIYGAESERISEGFLDKLYGYALAVTGSNGETVLVLTCDHTWFPDKYADQMRRELTGEFGLKEENIVCTGTHNHSGVATKASTSATSRYLETFGKLMLQAARDAMADRSEAALYAGSAKAPGLNFVRRYVLKDGTYPNFESPPPSEIAGHESDPDDQLQVLRIVREGKKDVAIFNWQAHLNMNMQAGGRYNVLTADIFGPFRDEIQTQLDVDCFAWNGACGNLNPTSKIPEENPTWDHREYGKLLSKYGVEAFNNAQPVAGTEVKLVTQSFEGQVNHEFDDVVGFARQVQDYYKATGDSKGARAMGEPYGINTEKHAGRIISNAQQPATREILLKAFSIGDMGFICLRYEMFDSDGMYIKENSPFKQTFIIGYNERGLGYLPSKLSEDHGGYEVDNNVFVLGTAQQLADSYLGLLETLHK